MNPFRAGLHTACAFSFFLCVGNLSAQIRVTGFDSYTMPTYLVLPERPGDGLELNALWTQELNRAGFHVIRFDRFRKLYFEDRVQALLATDVVAAGDRGIRLKQLKEVWTNRGEPWTADHQRVLFAMLDSQKLLIGKGGHASRQIRERSRLVINIHRPLPQSAFAQPHAVHFLTYRCKTRPSITCLSLTLSELRGEIRRENDLAGASLVQFDFEQGLLGTDCPDDAIARLVSYFEVSAPAATKPQSTPSTPVSTTCTADTAGLRAVRSVAVLDKPGKDCESRTAQDLSPTFSTRLLSCGVDVVERKDLDLILEEHKLEAAGLTDEVELRKAGYLKGADALFTVQAACRNDRSVLEIKILTTQTGQIVLTGSAAPSNSEALASAIARIFSTDPSR